MATETHVLLSVVVPVYNLAGAIAETCRTIRDRVEDALGEPFELIVVSDGSIDRSEERVLESRARGRAGDPLRPQPRARVTPSRPARSPRTGGSCPTSTPISTSIPPRLAGYVGRAEREALDFAIGSKRHPESVVHYPRSRRVDSWLYQQLVRVLFRLDVRDTQVGLKVFRREVAEQVLPLLLVKRFAFDLELLAVAPRSASVACASSSVRLDYRFTGSGVRSSAVAARARRHGRDLLPAPDPPLLPAQELALAGAFGWTRPRDYRPLVSVVTADPGNLSLDWPELEVVRATDASPAGLHAAAGHARGEVLAFLEPGARPASNWLSATTPFLRRGEIWAVVVPKMAPHGGGVRSRAAAAIAESRLGGGSLYFRYTPGNLRYVDDFPGASVVVARDRYLELGAPVALDDLPLRLNDTGGRVLYTPETVAISPAPPLFGPHLRRTLSYGRGRGHQVRLRGLRALRASTLLPIALTLFVLLGPAVLFVGGMALTAWVVAAALYVTAICASGVIAALRFHSLLVSAATTVGLALTHVTYAWGFIRGLADR